MIRSTLSTFTKHTMGRVRRRTSTKQRSITLVARRFRLRCWGKANIVDDGAQPRPTAVGITPVRGDNMHVDVVLGGNGDLAPPAPLPRPARHHRSPLSAEVPPFEFRQPWY